MIRKQQFSSATNSSFLMFSKIARTVRPERGWLWSCQNFATYPLSERDAQNLQSLLLAAAEFNLLSEILADRVLARLEVQTFPKLSRAYSKGLQRLYELLIQSIYDAAQAIKNKNLTVARRVIDAKPVAGQIAVELARNNASASDQPDVEDRLRLELDFAQTFRILFMTARRAAKQAIMSASDLNSE